MKTNFYRVFAVGLSVVCGATIAVGIAAAATTIGTNIQTGGTLSVTGAISASSTISIGNLDADFTPDLQGWAYAINSINRINTDAGDGHANLEATVQSIAGAEGIWGVAYVTGNGQEDRRCPADC
jgi:hypothetical protein